MKTDVHAEFTYLINESIKKVMNLETGGFLNKITKGQTTSESSHADDVNRMYAELLKERDSLLNDLKDAIDTKKRDISSLSVAEMARIMNGFSFRLMGYYNSVMTHAFVSAKLWTQ